jgi:hypothetical protein
MLAATSKGRPLAARGVWLSAPPFLRYYCGAMHITLDEAVSLLDSWKTTGTVLRVHLFRAGQSREVHATVKGTNGAVLNLDANGEEIVIDLDGAEFNGDRRSAPYSNHGAYLVCEYRNGDRLSFYAQRAAQQETKQSIERRRVP